jgi:pheromone shutdown protein TraB
MENSTANNSDTVHRINDNDKEIIIVATAHVSKKSRDEVRMVIDTEKPDSVCVELDQKRYKTILDKDPYSSMDIVKVIKEGKTIIVLVNLLLSSFQRKIAKNMDVQPGAEMIQGIKSAEEHSANIVLADRDIQITFKRIWRKANLWEKLKLLSQILGSFILSGDDIKEEEIEKLKTADILDGAINLLWKSFPLIKEVLLDERDRFIAHNIRNAQGKKIVAVLGAAHVPGVMNYLTNRYPLLPDAFPKKTFDRRIAGNLTDDNEKKFLRSFYIEETSPRQDGALYYTLRSGIDRDSTESIFDILYNRIPKAGAFGTVFAIFIPVVLLAWIIYGFFNNTGVENLLSYILGTGCGAALGSLVSLAHPLTVLVGFIAAPITVMHPLLGVGWFTGLSEALLKKPKVSDLENLNVDIKTIKGLYKNRFSRILLVVIVSSLGTNVGIFFGIPFFSKIVLPALF